MRATKMLLSSQVSAAKPKMRTWQHQSKKASKKVRVTVMGKVAKGEETELSLGNKSRVVGGGGGGVDVRRSWESVGGAGEGFVEADVAAERIAADERKPARKYPVNYFKSARLNGFDETLCQADRPITIVHMASSDISITENDASEPPTTLHHPLLSIRISTEGLTTEESIEVLSKKLQLPFDAFTPSTNNTERGVAMTQTIFADPGKKDTEKIAKTLTNMVENNDILMYQPPAGEEPTCDRLSLYPRGVYGGLPVVFERERAAFLTINSFSSIEPGTPTNKKKKSFTVDVLMRGVYEPDVLMANISMVGHEGFLNLAPLPYGGSPHGLDWVEAGTAAINGDYRAACGKVFSATAAVCKEFAAVLDTLMSTVGAAKMTYVDAWYKAQSPDVLIDSHVVMQQLKALPEGVHWVGEMLYTALTDTSMGRFKKAWVLHVPETIRAWIEESPTMLLWNKLATERLMRYGVDPVIGDVVRTPLGAVKTIKTDAERVTYTRHDVLLPYPDLRRGPQWCRGVVFPKHAVNQTSYEITLRRLYLHPDRLHPNEVTNRDRWGAYRNFTALPRNVTVEGHEGGLGVHAMATNVTRCAALNAESLRAVMRNPKAPQAPVQPIKRNVRLVETVATVGKVLTRDQWSKLLLGGASAAPLPPAKGGRYASAKTCDLCGVLNHPEDTECNNCLGQTFTVVEKPMDGSDTPTTFKVSATIPEGAALEAFLNEVASPHCWRGYDDPSSRRSAEMMNVLSFLV